MALLCFIYWSFDPWYFYSVQDI